MMKLFRSKKQKAIEHWIEMADRYDGLADEHYTTGRTMPLAVHYRCVAALYRIHALELKGKL